MPALTLDQMHAVIGLHMNKGAALDGIIPTVVRQQARFLEQNYSFNYMDRFVEVTLPAECRGFDAPALVKKWNFFRFVTGNSDGSGDRTYQYLQHVNPIEVPVLGTTTLPVAFWTDSDDKIFFDAVLVAETIAELSYTQYTDWPTDVNLTPKIIIHAEGALLYSCVMALAPYVRNPEMMGMYSQLLKDALTALTGAQMEYKTSASSLQMVYE